MLVRQPFRFSLSLFPGLGAALALASSTIAFAACSSPPDPTPDPPVKNERAASELGQPGASAGDAQVCVQVVQCIVGTHWDKDTCMCEPNGPPVPSPIGDGGKVCVQVVQCIVGTHWDPTTCMCEPDGAPPCPAQPCSAGQHWDVSVCACAPDDDAGCTGAHDGS